MLFKFVQVENILEGITSAPTTFSILHPKNTYFS